MGSTCRCFPRQRRSCSQLTWRPWRWPGPGWPPAWTAGWCSLDLGQNSKNKTTPQLQTSRVTLFFTIIGTDLTTRSDHLLLEWATSCSAEITPWLATLRGKRESFFLSNLDVKTAFARPSHLTVPPLTVLFMLSRRRSLASLRLHRSSSSMRVSRLSVSLHSSFTAPTFSMKIRSFKQSTQKIRTVLGWKMSCTGNAERAFWDFHHLVNHEQVGDGFSVGAHHVAALFHRLGQDLLNLLGDNSCRRTQREQTPSFTLLLKRGRNKTAEQEPDWIFDTMRADREVRWGSRALSMNLWNGYRSLLRSLCPRWQQTQACTDNAPASSERSVSNCLWCWPTQTQWEWGMKTGWANVWINGAPLSWAPSEGGGWGWKAHEAHRDTQGNTSLVLTSWTFSLALMSEGCTSEPMTFRLPWTTRASSGRSVLTPTRPWWYTESGSWPRCHSTSLSLSNWPGLEAWRTHTSRRRRLYFWIQILKMSTSLLLGEGS